MPIRRPLALLTLLALVACKKDDGGEDTDVDDTDTLADTDDTDVVDSDDTDVADTDDTDVASYFLQVTVSGLEGDGVTFDVDGAVATVESDGTWTFSAPYADGAPFHASVLANPICPAQACTISGGSGTIDGADAEITVTCGAPRLRLFTSSWWDDALRVTDDLGALADGATATPRVVVGASTGIQNALYDSVAVDPARDLLYVADHDAQAIRVWEHASTVVGDVAPDRVFWLSDGGYPEGLELDPVTDRLYVGTATGLVVIDAASTRSDSVVPVGDAAVGGRALSLDRRNDRLYVASSFGTSVAVFDQVSALSGTFSPSRSFSWTSQTTGFKGIQALAVDACTDRLYLGSNWVTPDGASVVAFDAASTLSGAVDLDADADATDKAVGTLHLTTDGSGRLYQLVDSATSIRVHDAAATWSGVGTRAPSKTVAGVIDRGYGAEVVAY